MAAATMLADPRASSGQIEASERAQASDVPSATPATIPTEGASAGAAEAPRLRPIRAKQGADCEDIMVPSVPEGRDAASFVTPKVRPERNVATARGQCLPSGPGGPRGRWGWAGGSGAMQARLATCGPGLHLSGRAFRGAGPACRAGPGFLPGVSFSTLAGSARFRDATGRVPDALDARRSERVVPAGGGCGAALACEGQVEEGSR